MEDLTMEQLQARLAAVEAEKTEALEKVASLEADKKSADAAVKKLKAENADAKAKAKAAEAEAKKAAPVSFDVEEDGGDVKYEFTAPKLTWDDGSVVDVRALSESDDKKDQELYAEICAKLVQRGSGLVRRKED